VQVNLATHIASGVANFTGIESLIGTGAADTLVADNIPNTWNLTAINAGNINGAGVLDFITFENLTGGTSADTFVFSDAMGVTGLIDGAGAIDTFDYTAYTTAVTVNLQSQSATGTAGFANVERFIGGTVSDTLTARDLANTWTISNPNSGDINATTSFNSFENLTGGILSDSFRLAPAGSVSGTVNGLAGADTLDYSLRGVSINVNLQTFIASDLGLFSFIETFIGSTASDSLVGRNAANTWHLTANNAGDIGAPGVLDFSSFENLSGGSAADNFIFSPGVSISGALSGAGGIDTLNYGLYTTPVVVQLLANTATGTGSVAGLTIENLTGGSADDILIANNIANTIQGGLGNDVLIGNTGLDSLVGNDGRDILIGGLSLDTLNGGLGEDILIGGTTSWDSNLANLANIMTRWLAAAAYNVRITDLKTNVPQLLPSTTVFNDGSADVLTGGADLDWFLTEIADSITDFNTPAGETNDVF
jgi:Ca2+-binding RTX toxin-like protein